MPILNANVNQVGQAGVLPAIIYLLTNDTLEEVTTTGYLNGLIRQNTPLNEADMALITTKTSENATSTQISWLEVSKSGENWSLVSPAQPILSMQKFVSINQVLSFGTGTWTTTRIAQGNYVKRHTPGDETSIIGVDITPMIMTAASKGFRLDSFDVIYSIGTAAMDAHTVTLDRIEYANNVAVSVNSIAITGILATSTQANPYVTNVSVNTPAFDVTADSKYVIEVTADNAATTTYDFYGIMLRFSQKIA